MRVGYDTDRMDGALTTAYASAATEAAVGFGIGNLLVQPRIRFGWASDSTPLQSTYPLGGDEGFPGLRLFERRGVQDSFSVSGSSIRS
jgi:hypothetical protein